MALYLKADFLLYINALPIRAGTKKNYRCFVNRMERYISQDLTPKTVQSEQDVARHAAELAAGFAKDHKGGKWIESNVRGHARCVIRHYLKFLKSSGESLQCIQEELDKAGEFDPSNSGDGRKKVLRSIALRRGQPKFRRALLTAYGFRCAVTGTCIEDVLEAAHIVPYNGDSTNHVCNGLLLRSDIHALFDLGLLSINPETFAVYCSEQIRGDPMYRALHGAQTRRPANASQLPNRDALKSHFENRVL